MTLHQATSGQSQPEKKEFEGRIHD